MRTNLGDLKIFFVEFGEPDTGGYHYYGPEAPKPLHVMAKDYNEATNTAMEYATFNRKNLFDSDGSLIKNEPLKIKSVRCICDNVIW